MASRSQHMLASVYDVPAEVRKTHPVAELMDMAAKNPASPDTRSIVASEHGAKRRSRIWDMHTTLHCSIIGTCMPAGELRRLLVRLKVSGADVAGDHDMHTLGVLMAARPKEGAKLLQKALDRRHRVALNRFAKAKDTAAICALWEDAMRGGDVPGAYWALLTHPLSTDQMIRQAFGDVHMLSHLVGATNRADLHRLRQLEAANAALTEKLERQQKHLRDGFIDRDETIRRLKDTLAQNIHYDAGPSSHDDGQASEAILALNGRLAQESERRERLEQRLAALSEALRDSEQARHAVADDRDALRAELASCEIHIDALLRPDAGSSSIDLDGMTVLYVGGRANQTPHLKALVERANAQFLHHDGGIEHSATLLPGLVSRADVSVFPVDCVSHDAVASLKRTCRQLHKPFIPLRTASLTNLLSALSTMRQPADLVQMSD